MKTKRFQLVIRNMETKEYVIKEISLENELNVIEHFQKCWNENYFTLIDINKILNDDDISVGDMVEIIHIDKEEDCMENLIPFLGAKGVIVKIDFNWEYPYLIKFENDKLNNPEYLWRKDQIRAI